MSNPLVSVIIPNYCHAKYLDQRIQSVLNQTYRNFEVVILDDASPDDGASRAVIEKYSDNPHVVHIEYNEVNSGSTFKQWRKGFELAKGKLIWIAESDDYCELNFLDELIPMWMKYPDALIVQSASCHVNECGCELNNEIVYTGKEIYEDGLDCIKNHLICSNFYIPNASAVLFKKEIALNIPQDYVDYKASGDRLFWIYLAERGHVVKVDKPLNYFRQHNNKVSSVKEQDGTQCRENYMINKYLYEKGYVRGKYRLIENMFYWNYISKCNFKNSAIEEELLELWFGKWCYKAFFYRFIQFILNQKVMLYRLLNK